MPGELEKFKIFAFLDENYLQPAAPPFTVQINPETYSSSIVNVYNTDTAQGTNISNKNFNYTTARRMDFEFLFDSSGVLPVSGPVSAITNIDINITIAAFKELVFEFFGTTHQPRYLILVWGTLIFKCRLINLDITYKLFRPDGIPIRAVAKCTFEECISSDVVEAILKLSSPDLTHIRTVLQGDTLPLMCYNIYGDSKYYIEVARVNNLNDFKNLQPGQQIFFPPLEK